MNTDYSKQLGMRPTTEVTLGGRTFLISHWKATHAFRTIPKVGRYFAIPFATVIGSIMQGGQNFSEALPTACLYLFEKMEENDIIDLFDLILNDVYLEGSEKVNIDLHFDGKLDELLQLIIKVLEVNYDCFFKKDGFANIQTLLQKMGMLNQLDKQEEE